MPVVVLEARDFLSPVFLLRTSELLASGATFSLVASLSAEDLSAEDLSQTFRTFCTSVWCFFFAATLLVHAVRTLQFHSLLPLSWKNLTATVAALGALLTLSAAVLFAWRVLDPGRLQPRAVAAAVTSCLTCVAYATEALVLRAQEGRGYMASASGLLKVVQLWGGVQMVPLSVKLLSRLPPGEEPWPLWALATSHGVCLLAALLVVAVVVADVAGRCFLPFDRLLAGFDAASVLLQTLATVVGVANLLQLGTQNLPVVMVTVVSGVTLLAYALDLAFAIKLLCERRHA
ncbi:unnamed protein product [Ophioblennius macclurei]